MLLKPLKACLGLSCILVSASGAWAAGPVRGPGATARGTEPGANASLTLSQEQRELKFSATFGAEAISLNSPAGYLIGMGLWGAVGFSVLPSMEVGVGFSQGDSLTGGFSLLYTAVDISVSYAVTGSFRSTDHMYLLEGQEVAKVHHGLPGGFRVKAYFTQFFLNGSKNIVSFNGPGLGAAYEWASISNMNPGVLARVDFLSSSVLSIQNWQFSFIYSIHY